MIVSAKTDILLFTFLLFQFNQERVVHRTIIHYMSRCVLLFYRVGLGRTKWAVEIVLHKKIIPLSAYTEFWESVGSEQKRLIAIIIATIPSIFSFDLSLSGRSLGHHIAARSEEHT